MLKMLLEEFLFDIWQLVTLRLERRRLFYLAAFWFSLPIPESPLSSKKRHKGS